MTDAAEDRGVPVNSTTYDLFILVLTIFSLIIVLALAFWPLNEATRGLLINIDFIVCLVFLFDFFSNMRRSSNRKGYFFRRGGWLDLLGSIPAFPGQPLTGILRLARIGRLARIIRIMRHRNIKELWVDFMADRARSALLVTIFVAVVVVTISAIVVLQVESRSADANILTGGDAFWWAFVTVTTVGYGDLFPTTGLGRIMAMILMVVGVGIFGVLTSFLATTFLESEEEEAQAMEQEAADQRSDVKEEIEAIRNQLTVMQETMQRLERRLLEE
jgi:voltage-gated potassium channel